MSADFRVALDGQSVQFRFQTVSFAGIREIVEADITQDIDARATKAGSGSDFATPLNGAGGGSLVGNQLSAGDNLRTQTLSEFIEGGPLMPSMFAGTDEERFIRALTEAGTVRDDALGQTVQLPRGEFEVTADFNILDRVTISGVNKRGTVIKAASSFGDSYMATVVKGTSSMFDNCLRDLTLNCNDVAGLGGVLSSAWQEGGGLRNVLIQKFTTEGVRFRSGYGGAALTFINDSELFGSDQIKATTGIYVEEISSVGAFTLHLANTTIAGSPQPGEGDADAFYLDKGVHVENDSLVGIAVHFETTETGFYLDGAGHHVFINCTGASTVTNLFEFASTFTGTYSIKGCRRWGATNLIKDNRTGGLGTLAYDTDLESTQGLPANIGDIIAIGNFDGTTGASPPITNCTGVTSIARDEAGLWTLTLDHTLTSANHMTGVANSRDPNGCARVLLNTANTVQILNTSFGSTKQDTNEINFVIYRSRLG